MQIVQGQLYQPGQGFRSAGLKVRGLGLGYLQVQPELVRLLVLVLPHVLLLLHHSLDQFELMIVWSEDYREKL